MIDKYYLNYKEYTKSGIIAYAENQLKLPGLSEWENDLFSFVREWFSETIYISIFTSGSTGTPKEIRIPKERMLLSAKRTLQYFDIKLHENLLLCLPVKYIAGMMMVVRAFAGSLNLITVSAHQLKLGAIKDKIGFTSMVPMQMERLLNEHQNLDFIHKLLLGGTPVSNSLSEKLKKLFKGKIWETYGMTETITHVAVREIHNEIQLFHALPGISFSTDDRGCLIITDPLIQDHPIITNDRVELLSKTSFRLLGRVDRVINSGGVKIQTEEVERLLEPFMIGRFCISSMADNLLGEMVVLVVEKEANLSYIKERLSIIEGYSRPKKVIALEKIPVTSNGKIDYNAVKLDICKLSPC